MEKVNGSRTIRRPIQWLAPDSRTLATGLAAFSILAAYFLLRNGALFVCEFAPNFVPPLAALYLVVAVTFCRVRYSELPLIFSIFARITALGIFTFLVVERPGFTLVFESQAYLAAYVNWGAWIAIALALVSLWRVSFLLPVGFYCISTRFLSIPISGFEAPDLDIRYMMDLAQFLAFGAGALTLVGRKTREKEFVKPFISLIDRNELAVCITFIAFGLHLGNYFWSGYEKLVIGPFPWTWLLENQTQNLMPIAIKRGILPWPSPSPITQFVYDAFGSSVVLSNLFVLITQLLAIVAVLRLGLLRLLTIAYDLLHLGIYIFGGLFFWPWIWNNISILLAVRGQSEKDIGWLPRACCLVTVLSGFDSSMAASATLAWFDVLDIKVPVIQAQAPDGTWLDVPVSFFMNHSQLIVMGLEDRTKAVGHYSPTIRGGVLDYQRLKDSGKCLPPAPVLDAETSQAHEARLATLRKFVIAHHKNMLWLTSWLGRHIYYFHSHHQPSNPFLHRDFEKIKIEEIRAYRLVVQSICMGMTGGALTERELRRDEYLINLK